MSDQSPAYHYAVIGRALREIDAAPPGLPLEDLAARMQMSAAHFQRTFSQWVGISPKKYQQYLSLDHARRLLAERHTTLATAQELGLSGTGRLHDLFLSWEAMSPGAYARGGAGVEIYWGWFASPFGRALVMGTERGICGIGFGEEGEEAEAFDDLQRRWPKAEYREAPERLQPWVQAAFGGGGETKLHLIGAPFQIKVWEALLAVPSGHVTTYGDIAGAIGHPSAHRAVGTAVGRNPISFLIPCHRAIRRDGALGGYHWGLPRKRAMLAWEAARSEF
ncbi:bifunctional helix-turn-helix domain-containing protein/methylated-DNA--[protein]-cysteine S-methyltransferase [Xinfangfangia sp. CPCC 101601]|uniref:Bifunctional helix-turn-helix domain-containing protein/methylated-DNA--[protein]-cysteine S-methyltransferase n=1 Tax=Pseudogemmobacter lacusdianii TaxID=3069608 RepID=A0ABU0W0F6_9RHOB|nr:bifunctional helix-turn-helix domain-containing protein/methylated-DNA--[protein]-cysteine S-methyltransferase [Xinfangfangia sp. CPCC 101601]MDQ2067439.1 bifunctional helix-turn-helix domain-containing protein/methylated-DNA--[protein]-cysteine S-methyltransferase [Xinfangfangia sp. CPCC 101601]